MDSILTSPEVIAVIQDGVIDSAVLSRIQAEAAEFIILRKSNDEKSLNQLAKRYHDYANAALQLRKLLSQLGSIPDLSSDAWKAKLAAVDRSISAIDREKDLLKLVLVGKEG